MNIFVLREKESSISKGEEYKVSKIKEHLVCQAYTSLVDNYYFLLDTDPRICNLTLNIKVDFFLFISSYFLLIHFLSFVH